MASSNRSWAPLPRASPDPVPLPTLPDQSHLASISHLLLSPVPGQGGQRVPRRPCHLLPALGPVEKQHWSSRPRTLPTAVRGLSSAELSWLLRQDSPFTHTACLPSSWLGDPLCFQDQNNLISLLSGHSSLKWFLYWHPVTEPNPSVAGHTGPIILPPGPVSPACCAAPAGGPPQTLLSPCMPSPRAFSSSLPKGHSPSYSQHCGNRCHTAVPQRF